jgi:hypothetical protein
VRVGVVPAKEIVLVAAKQHRGDIQPPEFAERL